MTQTTLPSTAPPLTVATEAWDVELRHVSKAFGGEMVIDAVDLQIRQGEFFCILGPSGCGKTTLLRLIAGFELPTSGEVRIRDQSVNQVPPYKRPVNTVFQSYALFNHLTVAENIAFGLKLKRLNRQEIRDRVTAALAGVRLASFGERYPQQLSGGQRQRVALARALVNRPTVVLLDEPLGALDLKLRKEMQVELSRLHQEVGLTFVMVTHDQEEALSLADRIAVVRSGQIEQVGTPRAIYEQPRTPFVADFIGDTNLLAGQVVTVERDRAQIQTDTGLTFWTTLAQATPQQAVTISLRPEKIHLADTLQPADNCFPAEILHTMYLGTHLQLVVQLNPSATTLRVQIPQRAIADTALSPHTPIYVAWAATDSLAFIE